MAEELVGKPRESTPTVRFQDGKIGASFTGKLVTKKQAKVRNKPISVYEFQAIKGDAVITKRLAPKQYEPVKVAEGDLVALFGSTVLDTKLEEASVGDVLTITYLGVPDGKAYNDFRVMREDQ